MSAQRRLIGDARVWYESLIPAPKTYDEFRIIFRQHFWSAAIQRKVRNDVFRPWRHNRYDGLATHAMQWIASAKYLSPPIDQGDLVCTIIQHYPTPLGMAIRGRGPRNTNELLSILTEFDESASFCDNPRNDNGARPAFQHTQPNGRNNYHQPRRDNHGGNRFPPRPIPPTVTPGQPLNQLDISGNGDVPRP